LIEEDRGERREKGRGTNEGRKEQMEEEELLSLIGFHFMS
jgi:hypothetical protein